MSFDTNFKLSLTESLRKNKQVLYDNTLKEYKADVEDLFILSYYNRFLAWKSGETGEVDRIWRHLKTCLSKEGFPELIKGYHFYYSPENASEDESDEVEKLISQSKRVEGEFWRNASTVKRYEELSDFDCFKDLVIRDSEVNKYKQNTHYFNAPGWCDYYIRLLQSFLPDYQLSSTYSDKNILRFVCKISDQFHLGFEFDASLYRSEIKRYGTYKKTLHSDRFDCTCQATEGSLAFF